MPTVGFIEGIKLEIFYRDHPPPHLHASSAEHELLVCIKDGAIYEGQLPKRLQRKVLDYVKVPENNEKLMKLWEEYSKVL